jgi:esterase/lipase superfamily enzyme/GNAT superfamily N-acetyltransferase
MPGRDERPLDDTHFVPVFGYDSKTRRFDFRNRWSDWGDNHMGYLPYEYFDRYVFECWATYPSVRPREPREKARDAVKEARWIVHDEWNRRIFCFAIRKSGASWKSGWAFVVERDGALEIEEIYVRPEFRRQRYAARLCDMVRELASAHGQPLRLWVPFADSRRESPGNYPALIALAKRLGLQYQPCPARWAAYFATNERPGIDLPIEPMTAPRRPRCARNDVIAAARSVTPWQYTVWYATDRNVVSTQGGASGFGTDRGSGVQYGKCVVAIPRSHRFGSVGSPWFDRWVRGTDDRLRLDCVTPLPDSAFWSEVRRTIEQQPSDERQSLIYVHGFRISFEEAAIRAAQIGFDLKVPGVTAFFSWPSKAMVAQYPADEAAIEASEGAIADFLVRFARDTGSARVHLVAHSMGNRGLLRALQRIVSHAEQALDVSFGQIFVMAPDIDAGLFRDLADAYRRTSLRTTLYASSGDVAIRMSAFVHDYPRAGFIPPVTVVRGIDTIDVPKFNLFELGHSYYAEAAPVLHDMHDLIRNDAPPRARQRLVEMTSESGETYWRIMG